MFDLEQYQNHLRAHGANLGDIKKRNNEAIINRTFKRDPTYKKVYILTRDGWKYEDAKYQFHVTPSILKDAVDYYLQFRPHVHFPIGTYVIVPDDTSPEINLTEEEKVNPFLQEVSKRTQWWMIVNRSDSNTAIKYNIIKCNWEFKWILNGKIQKTYGAVRNANSYTSGVWNSEYSTSLDDINSAWLPDICYTYGEENLQKLGMDNNRTIVHDLRFMLCNNYEDPRVYRVTKIKDLIPQGLIRLTLKEVDYNTVCDNPKLGICNYYDENGEPVVSVGESTDINKTSVIHWMYINENNELDIEEDPLKYFLQKGKSSYFNVVFSNLNVSPVWHIECIDNIPEDKKRYYEGLLQLEKLPDTSLRIKPGKANSLIGKHFVLSVSDIDGEYASSVEMEVAK